jgi:hypothetical protein
MECPYQNHEYSHFIKNHLVDPKNSLEIGRFFTTSIVEVVAINNVSNL